MSVNVSVIKSNRIELGQVCLKWWFDLENNRGDRNRLRRATEDMDVTDLKSYHDLLKRLQAQGYEYRQGIRLCAAVLSHVRDHNPRLNFAAALAQNGVSETRFRQITTADSVEELFRPLIRAVRQSKGTADVVDLAGSVLTWGNSTREWWKEHYYGRLLDIRT